MISNGARKVRTYFNEQEFFSRRVFLASLEAESETANIKFKIFV